ncbi:hypothetical protein LEP1GSC116_2400 [Leptospira interrogans serovar Icterohaemorrhagiae str. Verdun HP]|uniref:Uncharacterized protein n=1 Tax=Leptospira interrogans serovar Icterohaemorrhagiae str. Verdun HP TaxID=1049910 RepID=M6RLI6_LEPIR|nr:hypothetical protein LEP1GSC116_2400 [Leptospira interrogans serovar Icterohaemorrhagiae str. Verdun HP]
MIFFDLRTSSKKGKLSPSFKKFPATDFIFLVSNVHSIPPGSNSGNSRTQFYRLPNVVCLAKDNGSQKEQEI